MVNLRTGLITLLVTFQACTLFAQVTPPEDWYQERRALIEGAELPYLTAKLDEPGNDVLIPPDSNYPDDSVMRAWNGYAPDEIIVKFTQPVANAIESEFMSKTMIGKRKLPASLEELSKKYKVKTLEPILTGFKAKQARLKKILAKNETQLSDKERKVIEDLRRKPKNTSVPALDRIYKIEIQPEYGQSLEEVVNEYNNTQGVEYAQLNYIVHTCRTPNDPLYPLMWSLNNTGQLYPPQGSGTDDADIDAPEAWDIHTGSSEIIVAVIDTGVDYDHRDLQGNLWINSGEIPDDGIDNDENGYVDDIYGYDFCTYGEETRDSDPVDDHGHGTHCAGTIAARGNNGFDIAGVCWTARIMAVKFISVSGYGYTSDAIDGIYYAVDSGANVLSNSWGGRFPEDLPALQDAINFAYDNGVVFIAAAGNGYPWEDRTQLTYPASMEHVISVAATDSSDEIADFSFYGEWVDIAAPGVDILSLRAAGTSMGSTYNDYTTVASGTSMACPHVAGACALLLSMPELQSIADPDALFDTIYSALTLTVDPMEEGICFADGRLNLNNAIRSARGKGFITLDQDYYTYSNEIVIRLIDFDLKGQLSWDVTITTNNGDSETVTLDALGADSVVFSGTIMTNSEAIVVEDGNLQITHNEVITVTYEDEQDENDNPTVASDTAMTDCQGPIISNVHIDAPGSMVTVTFQTDEPATAIVQCGLSCGGPYDIETSHSDLTTSHTIRLRGFTPETSYFLIIKASDALENETIDDNEGSCYQFTTTPLLGDIYVPSQCATIQDGIDRAWDTDTVWVADGIYTGEGNYDLLFYGKIITLKSQNGPENCMIDCQGRGRAFFFCHGEDPNAVIDGFTITHGYPIVNPNPSWPQDAERGAGIFCLDSGVTINNCRFVDNIAPGIGGAIYCRGGNLIVDNSTFRRNRGMGGSAIYGYSSNLTLRNCTLYSNISKNYPAALFCTDGNLVIEDCWITDNKSLGRTNLEYGGGILFGRGEATISRSVISGNYARLSGGGIYCWAADISLTNCVICDNTVGNRGGGIRVLEDDPPDNYCNLTIINCAICNNTAWSGGGLYCSSETETVLSNSILWGNVAERGTIYNQIALIGKMSISYCDIEGEQTQIYRHSGSIFNWGEGNIDAEPAFALTNDYHLTSVSACIDEGTNSPEGGLPATDLEGNTRVVNGVVDMGAYEFDNSAAAIALSTSVCNFAYIQNGSTPEDQIISVRNCGTGTLSWQIDEDCPWLSVEPMSGTSTGESDDITLSVNPNGLAGGEHVCELLIYDDLAINSPQRISVNLYVSQTFHVPDEYPLIQGAINAARNGDVILVADGVYTGPHNRDLDFYGEAITLKSENGPENCIIDCQGSNAEPHRAFNFYRTGDDEDTVIDGFTIIGGYISRGLLDIFPPLEGAVMYCYNTNPTVRNCIMRGNSAYGDGGAIYTFIDVLSYPEYGLHTWEISNCTFADNYAGSYGGAIYCGFPAKISNCVIKGNTAGQDGGGLWTYEDVLLSNSFIHNNSAGGKGGGAYLWYSYQTVNNCTFSENSAGSYGGAVCGEDIFDETYLALNNSILWDNTAPQGPEIALTTGWQVPAQLRVSYCNVQGGQENVYVEEGGVLEWLEGNIDVEPEFVDAVNDDYHLQITSPCIDAGDPDYVAQPGETDIDGEPRVSPFGIDMGADEAYGAYNNGQHFKTIQAAIDAANPGDTVIIAPGTYTGEGNRDIDFAGKAVTLQSVDPDNPDIVAATIIDCQASQQERHRGFYFHSGEGPDALLAGLTITNGLGKDESGYYAGGAIFCDNASSPTIQSCVFTDNGEYDIYSADGGAIACYNQSSPNIVNCIFENNISGWASAISCWTSSNAVIQDCEFTENMGIATVACYDYCDGLISGCKFYNNHVPSNIANATGGIECWASSPTIENCLMQNNESNAGGGVYCTEGSDPIIRNCIISDNTVAGFGGGICSYYSSPAISNCTIVNNVVEDYFGGGLNVLGGSPQVDNCIIWGNSAPLGNQVHYNRSGPGDLVFRYCDIQDSGGSTNWDESLGVDGGGNIDVDPLFADNYHISQNSPCIDVGDPNGDYTGQTDIDDQPRVMVSEVDIGADELAYLPSDHPDYNEWVAVGKPDCWCYLRQCQGDADGRAQDIDNYWVSSYDLDVLVAAWLKTFEEIEGQTITVGGKEVALICADFDHEQQGNPISGYHRVGTNDLNILVANWQIPDGPDPNCFCD